MITMRELRPYQKQAIDSIARKYQSGLNSVIFQLATGGGKTVAFAGLVDRFVTKQQKKVLILVHRDELLKQARRTLFDWYDIVAIPVTAGIGYLPNAMVYIAMVETANNRLRKNPNYFGNIGMVIVDEAHLGNFKKTFSYFPKAFRIGFTATPVSSSKRDPLKNHYQDIVCGIDIPDLIELGSLVPNITHDIRNIKRKDLAIKNGEFDEQVMGAVFGNSLHVQNCVKAYRDHALNTKTIIFNVNIDHSKKVNAAFQAFGYNSRHLDGNASEKERADTLAWFAKTPNAILNNVGVLTTGFDEPSVQTVIINKSTMSLPLWLQMTGRGSRPFTSKKQFSIIDMGENANVHGDWCAPRNWSDIFHNPEKALEGSGEAPSKTCAGCRVIIHASTVTCPHCGAINARKITYDSPMISLETLFMKRPLEIDVAKIIEDTSAKRKSDGSPYKDQSAIFTIRYKIIIHATRVWKLKKIDDRTANRLLDMFQEKVLEWCEIKNADANKWLLKSSRTWMLEELKRAFDYQPTNSITQKQAV